MRTQLLANRAWSTAHAIESTLTANLHSQTVAASLAAVLLWASVMCCNSTLLQHVLSQHCVHVSLLPGVHGVLKEG